MPVLIKVQRFWSEHHETLQVLLTGSLVTILAYTGKTLGAKLTRNREAETNVVHPFEIDMMTFMSISSSLNYIIFVIYSLSIPTNLFAIYSSVTNNTLSLSIRAIATSESVTRLAYTITIAFLIYCNLWPLSGSCSPDSLPYTTAQYGYLLLTLITYCQAFISLSRFMAISFSGKFFSLTLRWPFLQLFFCCLLGVVHGALDRFFKANFQFDFDSIVSTIIIAFMITLDFFTWRKLKNHQKKDKLTQAEKRLMKQMICSSVIYAINYLGLIVLHTIFAPFLGRFLLSLALQIVNVVRGGLYTLGQSLVTGLFLRRTKPNSVTDIAKPPTTTDSISFYLPSPVRVRPTTRSSVIT